MTSVKKKNLPRVFALLVTTPRVRSLVSVRLCVCFNGCLIEHLLGIISLDYFLAIIIIMITIIITNVNMM